MKKLLRSSSGKKIRFILIGLTLPCLVLALLSLTGSSSASAGKTKRFKNGEPVSAAADPNLPPQIDVRGGTPRGLELLQPTAVQLRALTSLKNLLGGADLHIRYNGLTATPMSINNPAGYLSAPSTAEPESIARDFLGQWREVFRFDDNNLNNLKLVSRAVTQEGTTVMLFQQQQNNLPIYHGEVLVNVNKAGQIINIGGDSFPRLNVTNTAAISPASAVSAAAADMGINGFTPVSLGTAKILSTYGNLKAEYIDGQKFDHNIFTDDIVVQSIVFPLGNTGRLAYKFNLTTPQYKSIMWQNIVDAETGAILRRISLTSSQAGGGNSIPRKGTFRPDVQNMVEAYSTGGAQGKVFDVQPTTFSPAGGVGRSVRTGTPGNYLIGPPTYNPEATLSGHFRYSVAAARNEMPLPFTPTSLVQPYTPGLIGQVLRGLPDAAHPTASSPFGWFYLPTDNGGQQVSTANADHGTTQTIGYNISPEGATRNLPANSPGGDGTQPFSADLTALGSTKNLSDGRSFSSVYQSRYTEGNNVGVSDDRANDNDATKGVKGYAANRLFNSTYYDYYADYEFGGVDATGGGTGSTTPVSYPASSNSDVYPATVNLFYFNNVEHDYLYSLGFTEQFWNFQFDNFGKGGAGNDGIIAEVQDGSGTDNANMSSPADGSSPRMQMYLFTEGGFRRSDGDLDWDVVAHEHYHGVSNRSAAKGGDSCLGTPLVGESGGMGEGWSDFIASSMSDDEAEGEYVTGHFDNGIRRMPYTNYRYSYGAIGDVSLNLRKNTNTDTAVPDVPVGAIPYEVHDVGEVWAAMLWDMRELMIMKSPSGVFFDGNRRLGSGSTFYIGNRAVQSVDTNHPINYRPSFGTTTTTPGLGGSPTINAANHIVRPGLVANENVANPARNGPLATAVNTGARLADKVTLRGLQLAPCNPTFVDMRDSMLAADREISGGENLAIMWRAFASHGVGTNATSTGKTNGVGQQGAPAAIVEDFTVPAGVTECETLGPLAAPGFTLANSAPNTVSVTIAPVSGAVNYVIARSTSANGPFTTVATIAGTSYTDNDNGVGLLLNQTYYYQVHAARSAYCVGLANTNNVTVTIGAALSPAPIFAGIGQVADAKSGDTLTLSWSPATSLNIGANIVYDIYRVINVTADTDLTTPTFTPSAANRIAQGVTKTTYIDSNLMFGQQYYYIVQARDTTNSKIDTNNAGNTITKLNAPSSNRVSATPPFAIETFDNMATANSRFSPALTESGTTPDHSVAAFQRVDTDLGAGTTNAASGSTDATSAVTGAMFAPDFDPGNAAQGGPSDFYTTINPTNLTRGSFLEFDHRFATEATFDGGNLEILLGASTLPVTPSPNNVTTFDLNDYIVQNGYNGNLNGTLEGAAMGSPLQGRKAFTGSKPLNHVKVAIGDFAPGGVKNPNSLPVYIRFHSTSDAGTFVDGWYIDNIVVNNYMAPSGFESDVAPRPTGDGSILSDDVVQMRRFLNGTDTPDSNSGEFQRADSSPLETRGDGMIQSNDIVQTRRYQNGTDAMQTIGGPTTQINSRPASVKKSRSAKGSGSSATEAAHEVRIESTTGNAGRQVTVNVRVDATGDEAEYGFVVNYDQTKLSGPVIGAGNAGAGTRSCNIGTAGKVNCSVGSFPNNNPSSSDAGIGEIGAGTNQILMTVTFNIAPNAAAGTTPVTLTNVNASNDAAQQLTVVATNGTVTLAAASRQLRVESIAAGQGQQVTVNIRVDAAGDEAEYGFVVNYDQTKLSAPLVGAGNAGSGTRSCNTGTAGKVNCSVGSFPNNNPSSSDSGIGEIAGADNQILITVRFNVAANAAVGATPVTLTSVNASNDAAQAVTITSTNGNVTIAGPTAATTSVSGQAIANGRGISGVLVTLRNPDGSSRIVRTNQFGYYSFSDVLSGRTYVLSAADKRYSFSQPSQVVNLNDDDLKINFIAR